MADGSYVNARQEYDEGADVMRYFLRDEPVADIQEAMFGESRMVSHFAANGDLVLSEIYGWTQFRDRKSERREYTAGPGSSQTLGKLDWEVTETATGRILGAGKRPFRLEEVSMTVVETTDRTLATIQVELNDLFSFGLAGNLAADQEILGFALVADRLDLESFSWDWFNMEGADRATKLQESGELRVRVEPRGEVRQIVFTEFLTDVSVRVSRMGAPAREPEWRVLIRAGSHMLWPSLIDGQIRLIR